MISLFAMPRHVQEGGGEEQYLQSSNKLFSTRREERSNPHRNKEYIYKHLEQKLPYLG